MLPIMMANTVLEAWAFTIPSQPLQVSRMALTAAPKSMHVSLAATSGSRIRYRHGQPGAKVPTRFGMEDVNRPEAVAMRAGKFHILCTWNWLFSVRIFELSPPN